MTAITDQSSTSRALRVTGAWTQLLSDWLDQQNRIAPTLRAQLDSLRPTDLVPMARWQQLLSEAVALSANTTGAALAIGAMVRPRHVGLLGYLVLSCRTLGEAMLAYQRYESLFYGRNLVEGLLENDVMQLRWAQTDATGELADTVSIGALVTFLRRLLDAPATPKLTPTQVAFTFAVPSAERAQYERFFGCPVRFAAEFTCISFPLHYLQVVLPHNDPGLRALLDRQAQALLAAQPDADDFERALQQVLLKLLPDGRAQLPQVASQLHLSVRSLQRRLAQRSSSWQQLLEQTRMTLADHYLADASLSLADIALLLGYSEHSAFSRACLGWHGQAPARRRKAMVNVRW